MEVWTLFGQRFSEHEYIGYSKKFSIPDDRQSGKTFTI